jgi:hypothetical protein
MSVSTTVELTIEGLGDKTSPHRITLQANEIDALIGRLANVRATMLHEVPKQPLAAGDVHQAFDPHWIVHSPGSESSKIFGIRHPGLGWVMFRLPASEAVALSNALLGDPQGQATGQSQEKGHLH